MLTPDVSSTLRRQRFYICSLLPAPVDPVAFGCAITGQEPWRPTTDDIWAGPVAGASAGKAIVPGMHQSVGYKSGRERNMQYDCDEPPPTTLMNNLYFTSFTPCRHPAHIPHSQINDIRVNIHPPQPFTLINYSDRDKHPHSSASFPRA